jgi:hypothetical protein
MSFEKKRLMKQNEDLSQRLKQAQESLKVYELKRRAAISVDIK